MQTFYSWAQDAALSVTNKIVESNSDVPEVKVCNAALRLMHQILNWEFRYSKGGTKGSINVFSDGIRSDTASARKTEAVIVQVLMVIGWLYLRHITCASTSLTCRNSETVRGDTSMSEFILFMDSS